MDEFPIYETDPVSGELQFKRQGSKIILKSPSIQLIENNKNKDAGALTKTSLVNQAAAMKGKANATYIQNLKNEETADGTKLKM